MNVQPMNLGGHSQTQDTLRTTQEWPNLQRDYFVKLLMRSRETMKEREQPQDSINGAITTPRFKGMREAEVSRIQRRESFGEQATKQKRPALQIGVRVMNTANVTISLFLDFSKVPFLPNIIRRLLRQGGRQRRELTVGQ
jgi:hypothetical protein